MAQKNNYVNQEQFDISIEDFDALDGVHEFSEKYKENKMKILKEYHRKIYKPASKYTKAAVVAALLMVSVPVITNAATEGGFFNRIWGSTGKENIASHTEVVYDKEKDTSYTITYPKTEYEDIDADKAEKLIGSNISYKPVIKKLGSTTLSVLSFVYDGNAAVAEFTLEKKGGVDALEYSQEYNESKGAAFSGNADFYFNFGDYDGKIYTDIKKSTKDLVYCYYYMTRNEQVDSGEDEVVLNIEEYPCTRKELSDADNNTLKKYTDKTKKSSIKIPVNKQAAKTIFTNKGNGTAEISPISMKIDMKKGLGLSKEDAYDPYNAYYVSINYKNGKKYIVHEHEMKEKHLCKTETDNASYTCGDLDDNLIFVFNRLVDPDNIKSVTINETEYTLKS